VRAVLAQLRPEGGDLAANARAVAGAVAAHPSADLAVFPELFLGGYDPARAGELAVAAGDPALDGVRDAARAHATAVLVGFAERTEAGGVANAVACIDTDGAWRATYRKTHLFGGAEAATFVAGETLRVVGLAGRRVAPLVCFDMEFPEPARAVARAGAELLVTVAANMDPYGPDHALAARARALDNRLPHLYVNRIGDEAGLHFAGGSVAVAADGSVIADLGAGEAVACVEIDLTAAIGADVDYLTRVRADLPVEETVTMTTQGGAR
jgi:predicted amidohydrolase